MAQETSFRHVIRSAKRSERGYVLFAGASLGVGLLAFAGLATDVGMLRYWKRRAQMAADTAAIGALLEVKTKLTEADYATAGRKDAEAIGIVNGRDGVVIDVNSPATLGAYAGRNNTAEAIVRKTFGLTFLQVLGLETSTVVARAVASSSNGDGCIFALAPTGSGTFAASGSPVFTNTCGIVVNSTSSSAMTISGSACVTATSALVTGDVVGTISQQCQPTSGTVRPMTHVAPTTDPFGTLPAPNYGSLTTYPGAVPRSTRTLYPAVYSSGIDIKAGQTVTFMPGLYVLKGSGLTINGGATVTGDGVTFYNTTDSHGNSSPITLNGNATIQLKAPTSGTYESILFFTDRAINDTRLNNITGDSTSFFEGSIYMKNVPVQLAGNGGVAAYTIVVADTIKIVGNSVFHNDYSSLAGGSPIRTGSAVVAE